MRVDAEDLYGTKLIAISPAVNRTGGFGRDDGASVRKVSPAMRSPPGLFHGQFSVLTWKLRAGV